MTDFEKWANLLAEENDKYFAELSRITLSFEEVENIVAFLKNFERDDLPDTICDEILPKLEDFLEEFY